MRGTRTRAPAIPYHRGILSLPFDVLIRIIELAAEDVISCNRRSGLDPFIERLSRVCRTFRTVVLNTVVLWTKIDERYCLRDDFSELMSRSKCAPLFIDIHLEEQSWRSVLSNVLRYKDRWHRLRIMLFHLDPEDITKAFPNVKLPALQRLDALFGGYFDRDEQFVVDWDFRSVTFLEIDDWVPPPGCLSWIRVLQFDSSCFDEEEFAEVTLRRFLDFLECTGSLEVLHFDVSGFDAEVPDELRIIDLPNIKELKLSNLRSIEADEELESRNPYALSLFARSIKVPNIRKYYVAIHFQQVHELSAMIYFISSFDSSPDALHPVTNLFVSAPYEYENSTMVDFFSLFRDLRELIVAVPYFGVNLLRSDDQLDLEHLHTLVLRKESEWFLQTGPRLIFNRLCANPKKFIVDLLEDDDRDTTEPTDPWR